MRPATRLAFLPELVAVECEVAVDAAPPVVRRRVEADNRRCTIVSMPASGAPKIEIPRWIQLVGLPLLLLFAWVVAGAVRHVVFLFLVAALIALLLNPLVRGLGRIRIPRGFSVAIVYSTFAAALIVAIGALGPVVVSETKT